METRIVRKRQRKPRKDQKNTPKYMDHKNSDVSSMPRGTESDLQTWNFDPIPSESRNWPDENLQGQAVHEKNWRSLKHDAQPWQTHHFIAKEFIKKRNKKIHTGCFVWQAVYNQAKMCVSLLFIRRVIFNSKCQLFGGWWKIVYFSNEKHKKSIFVCKFTGPVVDWVETIPLRQRLVFATGLQRACSFPDTGGE